MEFGLRIPSLIIFGLGEHVTKSFFLNENRDCSTYTMFPKDQASPVEEGYGNANLYGVQPFYMFQLPNKLFSAVFLRNLNDQDAAICKNGTGSLIYHKSIGGIVDFYFFYPDTAQNVLRKYHSLIGRPYVPPIWSLGYHQSKYGWENLDVVKGVVNNFDIYDIPLDVIWNDIDYMNKFEDFTVDSINYGGLKDYVNELHYKNIRYVPIIDAGIKQNKDSSFYQRGIELGVFIKSAKTGAALVGEVWPGKSVYPDFLHPKMADHWKVGLATLYNLANFDGIWIDMNECSNFCFGECSSASIRSVEEVIEEPITWSDGNHDPNEFKNLPYYPAYSDPDDKAISMSGFHYSTDSTGDRLNKEYNYHSLFSYYEAKATNEFFSQVNKRPFVLTRANIPGSGMFTTKWLGDNYSNWDFMRYSITGVFNYQLFGIPFIGPDTCGFMGDATEELCLRWMQLSSFFTFTRNHNTINAKSQLPYLWTSVATASRNAIRQKYSILRYIYSLLIEANLKGGAVIEPMFFEFPEDDKTRDKNPYQFMIGSSVLVCPVLYEKNTLIYPYFPNANWYNIRTGIKVAEYIPNSINGTDAVLTGSYEYMNVFVKGGCIIPYQNAEKYAVKRVATLETMPMYLLLALDQNSAAKGELYMDDGMTANTIADGKYRKYAFSYSGGKLSFTIEKDYSSQKLSVEELAGIYVYGFPAGGATKCCAYTTTGAKITLIGDVDISTGIAKFTPSEKIYLYSISYIQNKEC
jgi:alpha-glucosidase (family GH31 glycosyl hydrolase)